MNWQAGWGFAIDAIALRAINKLVWQKANRPPTRRRRFPWGDENLRENIPGGQKRRELPLERRVRAYMSLTHVLLLGFETQDLLEFRN